MTDGVVITGGGAVTALEDAEAALPETVRARGARVERVTRLVLAAGGAALDAAGLAAMDGPARPRVGVVVGTAFGCFLTNDAYARRLDMARRPRARGSSRRPSRTPRRASSASRTGSADPR